MSARAIFVLVMSASMFAGCFSADEAPKSDPTPAPSVSPSPPTITSESPAPVKPAGVPVNQTETIVIQQAGATPLHTKAFRVTPGFTRFVVTLKWFEAAGDGEVAGVGSVNVDIVGADDISLGARARLTGPAQEPARGELVPMSVPAAGNYRVKVVPEEPGATGRLMVTVQVAYGD